MCEKSAQERFNELDAANKHLNKELNRLLYLSARLERERDSYKLIVDTVLKDVSVNLLNLKKELSKKGLTIR